MRETVESGPFLFPPSEVLRQQNYLKVKRKKGISNLGNQRRGLSKAGLLATKERCSLKGRSSEAVLLWVRCWDGPIIPAD